MLKEQLSQFEYFDCWPPTSHFGCAVPHRRGRRTWPHQRLGGERRSGARRAAPPFQTPEGQEEDGWAQGLRAMMMSRGVHQPFPSVRKWKGTVLDERTLLVFSVGLVLAIRRKQT